MTRNASLVDLGPAAQAQAIAQIGAQAKRPKYKNAAQVFDNIRFDSKREALRYMLLKGRRDRFEITDLRVKPAWRIEIKGMLICDYVADFSYRLNSGTYAAVVEDVKSKITKTPAYRLKHKLMQACHGIYVVEIE